MKTVFTIFYSFFHCYLLAQPATEVYIFDLFAKKDSFSLRNPVNISENEGLYDNQPSFIRDKELLYTSTREGQTDVVNYSLKSGKKKWLTETVGSEYSPTKIPDLDAFSAINLKPDGEQLLWKYPFKKGDPEIVITDLKVGYHVWIDQENLFVFVLEEKKNSLYLHNLKDKSLAFISDNIGRSLQIKPGSNKLAFVDKSTEILSINLYDISEANIEKYATVPGRSEDMVWIGDQLIMGSGSNVMGWSESLEKWVILADLEEFNLTGISRMSVNDSKTKLAVVVSEKRDK